jgi:hypothetical protein
MTSSHTATLIYIAVRFRVNARKRKVLRESCPGSLRLCKKKKGSEGKLPTIIKVVLEKERF